MSKTYFALQDEVLSGEGIVVTLVDSNGKTIKAKLNSFEEIEKKFDYKFAETSKYYGQLMNDCHIFNPYLHRRFLPSVFTKRILEWNPECESFERALLKNRNLLDYYITCMINDVETIVKLYHTQDEAYEIRSKLLPIERVNEIIYEFRYIMCSNATGEHYTYPTVLGELKRMKSNGKMTVYSAPNFQRYYAESGLYWTIYNMVAFGKRDVAKEILGVVNPIKFINDFLVPDGLMYNENVMRNERLMKQIKDGFCQAYSRLES